MKYECIKYSRVKISISVICLFFSLGSAFSQEQLDFVNPFIGTSNFGTTNPGAIVPRGMVSVVPFNVTGSENNKWDKDSRWWSTPYSWDNTFFTGYSHVNLSGVGCPDLGVILLMPTTGELTANLHEYGSVMSKQKASPGYYSCYLDKYRIQTEVTSTKRSGLSRFIFPKGQSNILIDLGNGLTNETGASIKVVNNSEVEGVRMVGDFCYHGNSEHAVYFVARFSKAADSYGSWKKMPVMEVEGPWSSTSGKFKYYKKFSQAVSGDSVGAYFTFNTEENEEILVQVGVSYVSIENARLNLNTEQPGFNFEKVYMNARRDWNKVLSKIRVEGGTLDQKTVFYTALYHMQIHPNVFNDVNGQYPEMESNKIGEVEGRDRYTVFSLWDTYRNLHPFMSLVYPEDQLNMVRSMVDMYNESGWLPKWELNSKETYTMNGDPAFPVITDTYLRGLTDFDVNTAYSAMLKSSTTPDSENKIRDDVNFYWEHGYVPLREQFDNSVSVALEYYLADWNLGQLAKEFNRTEDFTKFNEQSFRWKEYFDKKENQLLRPKLPDGKFLVDFDPLQGQNFEPVPGFHEGTAWQYAFGLPHDINGLIKMHGGGAKFAKKLQMVFDEGLFDMANEPDMHYPFLFNYIKEEEWRTQKETSKLIDTYFKNSPGGLPGNDDCGTMSAWVAFAMMGIYPVCPGDMSFAITVPVFDKVVIELNTEYYEGKIFEIIKKSNTVNGTIKEIKLNGNSTSSFFLNHHELTKGGKLEIYLGDSNKF